MQILGQVVFIAVLGIAFFFIRKRVLRLRANVLLGKKIAPTGPESERVKNLILFAFGQKKMFDRPLVGIFHFLIYAGFLLINIEVLEIILDGMFGTHRLFQPFLGNFYGVLISFFELLALGVVIACAVFLYRRDIAKLPRFQSPELKGFPNQDAHTILYAELVLMSMLFVMNAADQILQSRGIEHYVPTGSLPISGLLVPLFMGFSDTALIILERVAWWGHILGIFGFGYYVTFSKHLHIGMAFPNIWYGRAGAAGRMANMQSVTQEVQIMLGMPTENPNPEPPGRFGAKDIQDLNWKQLMDAYSCTECGRCTSVCPANQTGKLLSPRKIMMDTRDRMEEVGASVEAGKEPFTDGKSLLDDYITREELLACTSCNACVDACPVNINPLDIILDMRRYVAMEEASTPGSWNSMFANVENNGAPWAFSAMDRANWTSKMNQEG